MSWIINSGPHCQQVKAPKAFYLSDFSDHSLRSFQQILTECYNSNQGLVPIYIESHGGSADIMAGIISLMESAKKKGVKFATVVNGRAMSAGAMVWSYGDEGLRFVGESALLMYHEFNGVSMGKGSDMKNTLDRYMDHQEGLFQKISKNLKKPKDWLKKGIEKRKNQDWYLNADQVVEEKLGVKYSPTFVMNVEESYDIV